MRSTKQKQVVLNAVLSSCDHPTAEVILQRSKIELPSINLATVYRNLNALVLENKIRRISISGGDRFDKTLSSHAHFKCAKCQSVFDVSCVDVNSLLDCVKTSVSAVIGVDVVVNGICLNCKVNS